MSLCLLTPSLLYLLSFSCCLSLYHYFTVLLHRSIMPYQDGYQQLNVRAHESFDQSGDGMASLVAIFTFLTTFTLAMRFVTRKMQKNSLGYDDLCMIPAWVRKPSLVCYS